MHYIDLQKLIQAHISRPVFTNLQYPHGYWAYLFTDHFTPIKLGLTNDGENSKNHLSKSPQAADSTIEWSVSFWAIHIPGGNH